MLIIENITSDAHQKHTVITADGEITLSLRFLVAPQIWLMDVIYKGKAAYGLKISGSVFHVRGKNYPFDFYCVVNDDSGLDPFRIDDFESERCTLCLITKDEMRTVRGVAVP